MTSTIPNTGAALPRIDTPEIRATLSAGILRDAAVTTLADAKAAKLGTTKGMQP